MWLKFLITNQLHIFKTSTSTHIETEQYHEKTACITLSDCTTLVTFLKDFIHHNGLYSGRTKFGTYFLNKLSFWKVQPNKWSSLQSKSLFQRSGTQQHPTQNQKAEVDQITHVKAFYLQDSGLNCKFLILPENPSRPGEVLFRVLVP